MNRTMRIVVSIVLCVWLFAMGIELGAYRERRAINATLSSAGNNTQQTVQSSTTTPAPQTTQPPKTTAPTTTTPTVTPSGDNNDTTTTTAPTTDAPTQEKKLPKTNEEIAKAYNDAINATKNTSKSFTATQVENVTMNLVDSSIPSFLEGLVSSVMQGLMGEETYTYTNGVDADGNTFKDNFPPPGKEAALTAAGIKSASSEAYGEGGYKLTITLVEETATYEVLPPHHSVSVGYLNLDTLGLPFDIQSADFQYAGATVTICVNGEGLVDSYAVDFPMQGSGTGTAMGMNATVTIEGGLDETWNITWQ